MFTIPPEALTTPAILLLCPLLFLLQLVRVQSRLIRKARISWLREAISIAGLQTNLVQERRLILKCLPHLMKVISIRYRNKIK